MLTRLEKEKIVVGIQDNLKESKAIFLTNLIGVSSNDAVSIRKDIREAKGKILITRNSLFARAAIGTEYETLFSSLKGPNAVAFAFDDAAAVAKSLKDAGKEHKVVEFKGGYLGSKALTVDEISALADLPSRDEMLGTLLATFNAPISALARVLYAVQEKREADRVEVKEETKVETKTEVEVKAEDKSEETKKEEN